MSDIVKGVLIGVLIPTIIAIGGLFSGQRVIKALGGITKSDFNVLEDKLRSDIEIKGLKNARFSAIYCKWENGEFNCDDANHSWKGIANIDLNNSGGFTNNEMSVQFVNNYKGDPICHVSFENLVAISQINPNDDDVTVRIFKPNGDPYPWSEIPNTFFLMSCLGEIDES